MEPGGWAAMLLKTQGGKAGRPDWWPQASPLASGGAAPRGAMPARSRHGPARRTAVDRVAVSPKHRAAACLLLLGSSCRHPSLPAGAGGGGGLRLHRFVRPGAHGPPHAGHGGHGGGGGAGPEVPQQARPISLRSGTGGPRAAAGAMSGLCITSPGGGPGHEPFRASAASTSPCRTILHAHIAALRFSFPTPGPSHL